MQRDIQKRQNEPQMLDIQFAAKVYCNKAEKLNYFVWCLCVLAALISLLVESESNVTLAFSIAIEVMAFILQFFMDKNASLFSDFRKSFDRYVLFNDTYNFDDRTTAHLVAATRRKDYQIEISNNGQDTPPGVKDWYEFGVDCDTDGMNAIIECQRQNGYWTIKMMHWKQIVTIFVGTITAFIFLSIIKVKKLGYIYSLAGLLALILKFIERVWKHYKYSRMIPKIEGALESASIHGNTEQILCVQNYIENLREIPIFGMDIIHKLSAKKYSKEYRNIQQRRRPHE